MNVDRLMQSALEEYRAGNLQQAEHLLQNILSNHPDDPEILYFLGIISIQLGKYDLAIEYLSKAIHSNLSGADTFLALGNAYALKKQFDEAIACYQKALQINPGVATAYNNLGNALAEAGRFNEAITSYQKTLEINPNNVHAYNNLGNAFRFLGRFDEAVTNYEKAIELDPSFAGAYSNLGNIFQATGKCEKALTYYQKAIELNPSYAEAYTNLGTLLREDNRIPEAAAAYDMAISYCPNDIRARWGRCLADLPIIYQDKSAIQTSREQYQRHLIELHDLVARLSPEDLKAVTTMAGMEQPFYLPYQGFNDRELQKLYGEIICKIMTSRYPHFAERPRMPAHSPNGRMRIGFVSGFFCRHTNWKLFRGWFANLNKNQFDLYGFYTGTLKDQETDNARKYFTSFSENITSFEMFSSAIRNADLHVLIYPEIGMDPLAARFAALRLAPIQCVSWGHPNTSGFPTVDYFLSSDLMEPPDTDGHYTEQLIRLPNLSIYYTPPDTPHKEVNWEPFGIRLNSFHYLCCQSLKKYLPQHDDVFPQIAREVGDCQFLFISHTSSLVTEQFHSRIRKAFDRYNLNADEYIVMLPKLQPAEYHAINRISDVYLDSIGWSGGVSTLESLDCNLPIVTTPGKFMRGRHSMAILKMIDVQNTIAENITGYIQIAVKLAQDSQWRKNISERIAENKHMAYKDKTCISALENFFEKVVRERQE
jgi:protein O-GlcNAc transferase